ncbi:MAG: aminopeptidase N [Pseudohongiellaceae bacterium]|jgi:aminopeptidase N
MSDSALSDAPATVRLSDYAAPHWSCQTVELLFDLFEDHALVTATSAWARSGSAQTLILDGRDLQTESVLLDSQELDLDELQIEGEQLILHPVGDACVLQVVTRLAPQDNTALEGLYRSGGTFCTQMEAEGFRRVTWFADRPDVLATYSTTVVADASKYPVLLANGNLIDAGEGKDGRHFTQWHDPHPKPCYLFALVAGDLARVDDSFTTVSGREVALQIFVDKGNEGRVDHAMASLKRAMTWDETAFGREYDLDIFMLVAVHDFNMGAMENKGLNIFNAALVLADPQTATDQDYARIEGVVGHEYFHNWSGNRVTCRDWFQLSLKEGLTVYRDQQFSGDMGSAAVQRIGDIADLRSMQFPEDAGPGAHPVRPAEYLTIDNFYTTTIYRKGAEVIRMLATMLGQDGFRKGTDLYFDRHDGQAVTTEDFVASMEAANNVDLTQFKAWYSQPGTPTVKARGQWDEANKSYTLEFEQSCHPGAGEASRPFVIPVRMGLLDAAGQDMPLILEGESQDSGNTRVLSLTATRQSFRFVNLAEAPVPSLLRGFSAPVRLDSDLSGEQLAFLAAHDSDAFNRYEAVQRLASNTLLDAVTAHKAGQPMEVPEALSTTFVALLEDRSIDPALVAEALCLPEESVIGDLSETVDVEGIHAAYEYLSDTLARDHVALLLERYHELGAGLGADLSPGPRGRRALRNLCLDYVARIDHQQSLCEQQINSAMTMTDEAAALQCLAHQEGEVHDGAMESFKARWQHEPLVMNKWLQVQASSRRVGCADDVVRLSHDSAFDVTNPNSLRALYRNFGLNQARFHGADGQGYRILGDLLLDLDSRNPVMAGRMATLFSPWRRFDPARQELMREQLQRLLDSPTVSTNTFEVASKSLP